MEEFSRQWKHFHSTGAPGPCSQFLVESEFLIYFYYLVCIILVKLCSLLCLSVCHVWSLSMDYIPLIFARILVPLVTLDQDKTYLCSNLLFRQYQSASILAPPSIPVCVHTCITITIFLTFLAEVHIVSRLGAGKIG